MSRRIPTRLDDDLADLVEQEADRRDRSMSRIIAECVEEVLDESDRSGPDHPDADRTAADRTDTVHPDTDRLADLEERVDRIERELELDVDEPEPEPPLLDDADHADLRDLVEQVDWNTEVARTDDRLDACAYALAVLREREQVEQSELRSLVLDQFDIGLGDGSFQKVLGDVTGQIEQVEKIDNNRRLRWVG